MLPEAVAASESLCLTLPGIGSLAGEEYAAVAAEVLPGPHGYVQYGTESVSVDLLAHDLTMKMPHLKRLHINGHSLGGLLGLRVAVAAKQQLPDLKLGTVVLHSSPSGIADARHGRFAPFVPRLPVGPGGKFLFSLTRGLAEGLDGIVATKRALRDARGGCSPRLWLAQLGLLRTINLAENAAAYRPLIDGQTQFKYCLPQNPQTDTVVDTPRASQSFQAFCAEIGAPFNEVVIPQPGHANVTNGFQTLRAAMAVPSIVT